MITKATIKYIQSLQHKKVRDEHNSFFAEGPKVVTELLEGNIFYCEAIYCIQNGYDTLDKKLVSRHSERIHIIEDFELEKISALTFANNVLAVFQKKMIPNSINIANSLTLVLDDIQDPGNLGTIIRIADWFGVKTIFCSVATADCYNPKVVQSTMASLGRVHIVYGDVKEMLQKHSNIKKYAAVLGGKNIENIGKIKEGIIIIGNESKGISAEVMALADEQIAIERVGEAESLNAGVAAGIILFSLTSLKPHPEDKAPPILPPKGGERNKGD
jgi:RNA methyltransferase, TrmH family